MKSTMEQPLGLARSGRKAVAWLIVLLGSLTAFGPLTIDLYLPALPLIADELGTSSSLAQLSLTACMLGLSVGQLFAGAWSDVRGRRMPLLIGLAAYAVASSLCALSPSIGTFVAMRFLQGLAGSAGLVIARAAVRDLYEGPELTKFYAMLMLVNGAAPILAPIAGGQLLKAMAWEGLFFVLAGWGLLLFAWVWFGFRETLSPGKRMRGGLGETLRTFRRLLGDRTFMGYALSQALVTAAMFAYISGSPFVLQDIYGISPQQFSLVFAMNGVGIIIASQTAGRLAARIGEKRLFVIGLVASCAGGLWLLAAILASAALPMILIGFFVVVSSVGIVGATGFGLAMRDQAQAAGSASALLGLLAFLLGGIVAPLVGIAGGDNALPMGIIIAVAELGAAAVFVVMIQRRKGRS
ncbi:multidrug effflux MFS transporter [Cohnella sp. GCM10027633]|uniref:multidrug effflux MFS transporter n=1 Tax=unclassified Cohnella TaxID=2636738 RepID=UPI003638B8DF